MTFRSVLPPVGGHNMLILMKIVTLQKRRRRTKQPKAGLTILLVRRRSVEARLPAETDAAVPGD